MLVKNYLRHIHKSATGTLGLFSKLLKSNPIQYQADNLATLLVCFETMVILFFLILLTDKLFAFNHQIKIFFTKYYFETLLIVVPGLFFIINKQMENLGEKRKKSKFHWTDPISVIIHFTASAGLIILAKQLLKE